MVIKLYQVDGKFCTKISDELTKVSVPRLSFFLEINGIPQNTGDGEAVKQAKKVFGINV